MKSYLGNGLCFRIIIFLIIVFIALALSNVYALDKEENFIHWGEYLKITKTLSGSDDNLTQKNLFRYILSLKGQKCEYLERGNSYVVSPICLLRKQLPDLDEKDVIDLTWNRILGFDQSYKEDKTEFEYRSASPFLKDNKSVFDLTNLQKLFLLKLSKKGDKILIPKTYIVDEKFKQMSFYVVRKDISLLKPCTKQNYMVALRSLDNYVLSPGEIFNLNKHISNLPGYCKGTGPQNLMFYGGVCGFASQLFRISIINPDMEVLKRYGHSVWLTSYYSDYIYGDDAAIYENSKQLEIKNNSNSDIYFKYFEKGKYSYFVAINPKKTSKKVIVSKKQTGKLSAILEKKVYKDYNGEHLFTNVFESIYSYKSDTIR